MKNKTVIKVKNLTKIFKLPHEKYSTAKQRFVNLVARPKVGELKALDNISFEVKKGEFFSIIGANGSGKSTLLKLLAEIYIPTLGSVEVKGKLSPFIELGVGFNPELTARENIFLNSAILGLSKKETEEKFDEIIGFAELEKFVDQKLKNFSSGMQVRLAFSIAIQAPAKILLVDEVLAVGDASFQHKCFDVFRRLKNEGTTIVFVTHALNIVEEFSDRAIFVNRGKLISIGKPMDVINDYVSLIAEKDAQVLKGGEPKKKGGERWGDGKVEVIDTKVETLDGDEVVAVRENSMIIRVTYKFIKDTNNPIFGLTIRNDSKQDVIVTNTKIKNLKTGNFRKDSKVEVLFSMDNVLGAGTYTISPAVANENAEKIYDWRNNYKRFLVVRKERRRGIVYPATKINIGRML